MFTGIIETTGVVYAIELQKANTIFWIQSPISNTLKVDQSVAHNGVCLTIDALQNNMHRVTAVQETLLKTNLSYCKIGDIINIERCILLNGRLDGHLVQGHVDATATCIQRKAKDGSWLYHFSFNEKFAPLIIEKGSISLNGVSLTVFNVTFNTFSIAVIPYTFNHTNMQTIVEGSLVNIEFDMMGKYIQRAIQLKYAKSF